MYQQQQRQMHIGVLVYGCGHHQAAWQMPDSAVERLGDVSYYQELAQLAERGCLDIVFSQTINPLMPMTQVQCLPFGLIHS